jgi:hypothetical protein
MSTIESRGMLTSTADFRSAARWRRIVVSERAPPMRCAAAPDRLSDPMSRMLSGVCSSPSAITLGRSPSSPVRSWLVMLLLIL